MNSRRRFLDALALRNEDRPPVWLMRQAGRYLPEYRKLKEMYAFREMVRTPELATEVTLQPIRRFPGLDAAILFSDILVIPEALGVPYRFREEGGIELERTVRTSAEARALDAVGVDERLSYVADAIGKVRSELAEAKALLGFCGAPWTLALYLVEGGSPGEGRNLREMLYRAPETARELLERLTRACGDYLRMQCRAGADAVQLFDSWAGLCPASHYREWCLDPIRRIRAECDRPVILFSRGAGGRLAEQSATGVEGLSVDWATPLDQARSLVGEGIALQGNFDPLLLETEPPRVREALAPVLAARAGDPGYVCNAGHGLSPRTKIECVEALLETIAGTSRGGDAG
jgi:uroporphyrinogen decarboxylase